MSNICKIILVKSMKCSPSSHAPFRVKTIKKEWIICVYSFDAKKKGGRYSEKVEKYRVVWLTKTLEMTHFKKSTSNKKIRWKKLLIEVSPNKWNYFTSQDH